MSMLSALFYAYVLIGFSLAVIFAPFIMMNPQKPLSKFCTRMNNVLKKSEPESAHDNIEGIIFNRPDNIKSFLKMASGLLIISTTMWPMIIWLFLNKE